MTCRIGIDVGGTFTDFVLLDAARGRAFHHKEPSVPLDPARAVELGLPALLAAAGIAPGDVALVAHGTTLSLNSLLQRRIARVGLVVSRGARDILELARIRMAHSFDFFATAEAPLVPRERVLEISARLDAAGEVVESPGEAEIAALAAALRGLGCDAVALLVLNAFAAPHFEQAVAARLASALPGMPVTASTEIWPDRREYERGMLAVMNAAITPVMRRYYDRLGGFLAAAGVPGTLLITASNGGSIDIATARARPIDTVLSGPASGVIGAAETASRAGIGGIVTFDMGGTSADIAIIEGGLAELTLGAMIGEIPLMLPVVDVTAIGAGGGSIVRVDGGLRIGPESAGADPGPACYGRGGTAATLTDCYLACGFLDPENFLGGRLRISAALAGGALAPIAAGLGYAGADAIPRAAQAALTVAASKMATEMRKMLARRGKDARDFTLLPYGGAGATQAAMVAAEAGIPRILVPRHPGTFCALGAVVAPLRRDFVAARHLLIDGSTASAGRLAEALAPLRAQATEWAATTGIASAWQTRLAAELRYPGQSFALTLQLDAPEAGSLAETLRAGFHARHAALYGFSRPQSPVELVRLIVSAIGTHPPVPLASDAAPRPASPRRRIVRFPDGWHQAPCLPRASLAAGQRLAGPAIIEQDDTTVVVPPDWVLETLPGGALLLTRAAGTGASA